MTLDEKLRQVALTIEAGTPEQCDAVAALEGTPIMATIDKHKNLWVWISHGSHAMQSAIEPSGHVFLSTGPHIS